MRGARWMFGLAAALSAVGCELLVPVGDPKLRSCTDGLKNGDETGKDCGGSCAPCPVGEGCKTAKDCETQSCGANAICAAPSCADGAHNGDETGKDCGGPTCPKCSAGEGCSAASDCVSAICTSMVCEPSCTDNVKDGKETDADCGGSDCGPCKNGKGCIKNGDCESGVCEGGTCADFLVWALSIGGTAATDSASVAGLGLNDAGGVVVAANFFGTLDFGGSGGTYATASNAQGFAFGLYGTNGDAQWGVGGVTSIAGKNQSVQCLAVDASSTGMRLEAIGSYGPEGLAFNNATLLPAPADSQPAAFKLSYDMSGNQGATAIDSQGGNPGSFCDGLTFGASSALLVAGAYHNPGSFPLGTMTVKNGDLFIADVATPGWGHAYNDGSSSDAFVGVATDTAGNVVAAGSHGGTLDFGGGARNGATDPGFVLKLSPTGAYAWDRSFSAKPDAVAVDGQGDAVVCGEFTGTVDLGAGALTSATPAIFVAKLGATTGETRWAKAFPVVLDPATPAVGTTIATDSAGSVIVGVTATHGATVDFGGGPISGGIILSKLDASGSFVWGKGFTSPAPASLKSIAVQDAKSILIAGTFFHSLDFVSKAVTSTAQKSLFVAKLSLPQ